MRPSLSSALGMAALACFLNPVAAQPPAASVPPPSYLQAELTGLLQTHPEILARFRQTEAAQHAIDAAYAGYLPKFDVFGQTGPQYIDSPVLKSQGGGTWVSVAEIAGARLTQKVFDGFATPAQLKAARLNLETSQYTLQGTQQNTLFDGINAYVEVLRQDRLVRLARDSEATIMRQLHLEDERVQRGAGIAVDVLQSKSRLQIAKERRVGFEGSLADAATRYTQVFGHAPDIARMSDPAIDADLLPADLDEAVRTAAQDNPAIDASLANVAANEQRKRLARSGYYPQIDIVAAANRENDNDLVQGTRTDMSVLIQATWNLFDGFATDAGVGQAAAEYQASRAAEMGIARKVAEETRLAWNELVTARERVALLENAVAIASEVFDARMKLREAGRETVINVLDAENEVYNARINLTSARGDVIVASYRVLQGTGRLGPSQLGLAADASVIPPPPRRKTQD